MGLSQSFAHNHIAPKCGCTKECKKSCEKGDSTNCQCKSESCNCKTSKTCH